MPKIHLVSTRLYVNAGMRFPLCAANAKLLDCDKSGWQTTVHDARVTCKRCLKIKARNRYA